MEAWWHRYPDQLKVEEEALRALGYPWRRDEKSWESGRFVIDVDVPHEGDALTLRAEYPDTYPYFPPIVSTPEIIFRRHQHPVGKNLCLLARDAESWRPGHDTLAGMLKHQLPEIQAVNAANAPEELVPARKSMNFRRMQSALFDLLLVS